MPPPLVVAGWDGATWAVLDPLLAAGRLPTMARLASEGSRATLLSTWPPVSAAAWVTVMTGLGPGGHGVFDFRNLDVTSYEHRDERLSGSDSFSTPTLYEYLGAAGLRTIADSIPLTYPPWPIDGVMVAGYPTPDARRPFTSPASLADEIGPWPNLSPDVVARASPGRQAEHFRRIMSAQTDRLLHLAREPWDLLFFVNGAVDGAQHRFFKYVTPAYPGASESERERFRHLLAETMVAADAELGRLLAGLGPECNVLVISDHGGRVRPWKMFHLNAWLAAQGWLVPRRGVTERLRNGRQRAIEWLKQRGSGVEWAKRCLPAAVKERVNAWRSGSDRVDWAQTQAYRVKLNHPIEGIVLNVRGRQPAGCVPPDQYDNLRESIMAALRERPEVAAVRPREAVYEGVFMERAPDILVELLGDVDGGPGLTRVKTSVPAAWLRNISGYHSLEGILVASGPSLARGLDSRDVTLLDMAPTILHLLGAPVPSSMKGRVLTDLERERRPVVAGPPLPHRPPGPALDAAEESGLRRALRALGYLD